MNRLLKRTGAAIGVALALVVAAVLILFVRGSSAIGAEHTVEVAALSIEPDSAALARGAHLAGIYGCRDCHGDDLSGREMGDAPPFRIVAGNLTPGGAGAAYATASDWDRAIRHGVGADGRALFVMPSGAYNHVADDEAAALIAYLQSLPPVENGLDRVEWKPLGKVLAGGPIDLNKQVYTATPPASAPVPDSTVAYGEYLASGMCAYCHGANLEGKVSEPEGVLAPDLRTAGAWAPDQFHATMTTGALPDGRRMDPEIMPWTATARMTRAEREGLRRYLAQLGPPPEATTDA
jgi:mono/diheme cytochrome c family protein